MPEFILLPVSFVRFQAAPVSPVQPGGWLVDATFFRSLHEELKTHQLVTLRLLNATVLRIQGLADAFRRIVVRRLMGLRTAGPARLERRVILHEDSVVILDTIALAVRSRGFRIWRCRRATGIHMASSRYFQPQELDASAGAWTEDLPLGDSGPKITVERVIRAAS